MSDSSQDQKPQISTDDSGLLLNNTSVKLEPLSQPWELTQEITVKVEPIDEEENRHEQEEHLQYENVTVHLTDCMQCYVQVPQCEMPKQNDGSMIKIEADVALQLHEYREEQETTPPRTQTSQHSYKSQYDDFEAFCHEK